jgi:hypothetical protein
MKASHHRRVLFSVAFSGLILSPVLAAPSLSFQQRFDLAQSAFEAFDRDRYEAPELLILESWTTCLTYRFPPPEPPQCTRVVGHDERISQGYSAGSTLK